MASKFDDLMRQYGVTPPQNTKQSTTYIPAGYTGGAGNKGSGSAELDALMRKYYVDPTPGMRTRLTDDYMAAVGELNRRRREAREAQYAPAVRTNTDLTKPGTAAGRDFVAIIGGKEPAESTGKGRDSVVLIGGKGSTDTKEDTTKGRGSRSYLREGMLYGNEAPTQTTTSAINAQAQQDYQKALDAYRRVSAVSGPVSPQKQKEIDDARRAMEAAKQRADAAPLPDQSGWNRFVDNLQNIGEAAVTGMAAAYSGAERVLFEAGQSGRNKFYEGEREEVLYSLNDAKHVLEQLVQLHGGDTTNREVRQQMQYVNELQTKYDALSGVIEGEVQQKATQATTELTQQLEAQSQQATEAAKEQAGKDMGRFGAFAVDVAVNMLQMGGDAGVALATGGSSLLPMGFRVFGQSASEAEQYAEEYANSAYARVIMNGGSEAEALAAAEQARQEHRVGIGKQIAYGSVAAGIEVLTEKMFDGLAGIYGPGEADDISEAVVRRLASTPEGQNALRLFLGMNEEGIEEVISDILSPAAKTIYTGQSFAESYSENLNPTDVLYDYLVGAAAAGGQTAVNTVNPINSTGSQYRKANAKNARMTELYTELGEKPGILQEARDRGLLKALEAGETASPKNQERAAKLQQTEQTIEKRKNAGPILVSAFNSSGIELNETQQETLTQLAQEGDAGTKDTVLGMWDAFRLGQQGKTLEETTLAVEDRGLTPKQISRAWGFGASIEAEEAETADVNTEERKTRLEAALAALGARTEEAVKAYDPRQDMGRYSAAIQKAAFLYAANGADLTQIVQDAREGKTSDIVGYLTDEQVKLAQQIGQEQRQQVREAEKAVSDNLAKLRQQAAAITAGQTVTAQALAETDTAIDVANRASQRAVNAINQTYDRLSAMVKDNPNAENTEAYKQAYDEAMQQKKKIEGLQRTVRELTRKKAELEGKKTIKRKKGTISYAGGTVEGVKYEGVDPEKLTRQQKKVTAMVETLADAVNLDYVFISAEPGMGGAYVKGGTVYVNINAGMGVGGFSQTMAAASLSHELTHWMQDYAPEQYRELKDFIISEILKADSQELRRLVEQQRRWEQGRSLRYEKALDEVVANACQTMLLDSKAITKLARQNMSLAARIADYIEDWTNKIKDAFAEVDTTQGAIYDSLRAVESSLEHIQELWDNGIEAAAANYNAEKTVQAARAEESTEENENAAPESKTKLQMWDNSPVEDVNSKLVAVHNVSEEKLLGALKLGGLPMPSIAIVKSGTEFSNYGPISLLFGKETIDPQFIRKNRVYGGDAWTPTAPKMGYKIDSKALKRIRKRVDALLGDYATGRGLSTYLDEDNAEDKITRSNGSFAEAYRNSEGLQYAFLKDSGKSFDIPTKETTYSNEATNEELRLLSDVLNIEAIVNMSYADLMREEPVLRKSIHEAAEKVHGKEYADSLWPVDKALSYSELNRLMVSVNRMMHDTSGGEIDKRAFGIALREAMRDPSVQKEYENWLNELGADIVEKTGIRNSKDMFTPNGNRRTFEQMHDDYTLENIIKAMRSQSRRGEDIFGVNAKSLQSVTTPEYGSISEIKADSSRLGRAGDAEYDAVVSALDERITEAVERVYQTTTHFNDNRFLEYDAIAEAVVNAARGAHTVKSIINSFKRDGRSISTDLAEELRQIYIDSASLPTEYFEAKPERAVGFDEVLSAIIPDNASSTLKTALQGAGVHVDEYKAGDEADRLRKLNSVEGAQFQRWDNTDGDTAAEANGREQAYAQIESENAVLKETVEALRKLTDKQSGTIAKLQKRLQITKTPEVREGDAKRMAGQLVREYGSRADREQIAGELKALGDYILQADAAQLSEDEIKNRARKIAAEILDEAREQYAIEDENLAGIAKSIKGKKLTIDPAFLGELDQAGGFDALRKRNFGLFTLAKADSTAIDRSEYTSVSQFYSDLQSEYGKGYFPDLANEGEELLAIAENARAAAPMEINPYEQYMGETVEHLSNQIAMDALGGVLRAEAPKYADVEYRKEKSRNAELNEHIKKLAEENKITREEAGRLWSQVQELATKLDHAEMQYAALEKAAEDRIAQVRAEGSARQAEIEAREREEAAKNIKELKEHYKEMRQNARERRENTGTRRKIRKLIDLLNNRLKHPTETKHVPRELMQITLDVLEMIDLDTGRGSKTVAENIAKIRSLYEGYKNNPTYQIVYDEVTANMLDQLSQTIQGTRLQDMNESQLRAVYEALKSLTHVIDTAVKVKIGSEERNAFELSREMTRETRGVPKAQRGWLREKLIPAHLRADVAFRRFAGFKKNSAWETMAKLLNDGQLKETRLRMELSRPFEKIFSDQKALADFTGVNTLGKLDKSKLVDIGLKDADGKPILVTHDIMVGLYMDLLNEDNRRHFINGGKTIPNLEDYYNGNSAWGAGAQRSAGIAERLSELNRQYDEAKRTNYGDWADDLKAQIDALRSEGEEYADKVQAAIEAAMTEYDRAWVEACQQLMDVDSKRELNRTTMDVYGIEKASVPNYWPITSDPDFLSKPMETIVQDMSLENVGFMKERIKGANPSLALGTVQTVTRQIDRVSHYCGMMPAVRSFGKVWNKTEAGYADSIKKATREVFQKSGVDYVENLIADLNGGRQASRDVLGLSAALGKLRGNLAQTTLTLNVRVALAQAASYPTAAAELGWGPLAKALARGGKDGRLISRADTELIAKYSPLLYHRMQGYSSPELGDIQSSNRLSSRIWRKARWATGWIQAVDGATVGRLWYAAEYWVQENKPTLQKGTDAYYEAVAEKFNAVVEKTQPNYTTMQRAAILRDPDNLVKTFTMFMTQRLQNYNILYDAAGSYQKARADFANGRNGVTQEDVSEARQNVARAITSQLAQAAVYVGFKVLADALLHNMKKYRDKDTGDFTAESVSKAILDAYLDSWMGINIFGSELYGIVKAVTGVSKWYGLSVSGVDSVNDLIENMVGLAQADWSSEEGRKKAYAKLLKAGESLAQAMGIPLTNGIKLGQAVYYRIVDMANGHPFGFEAGYERTKKQMQTKEAVDAGVPKGLYLDTIREANTNGGTLAQDELGTYLRDALPAGKLTEDQADIIWSVQGWSTDRAGWNAKAEKKEAKAQWKDVFDAADAAGDANGSVKQEELASYLTGEIKAGRLTEAEAEEAWKAAGPTWKKSYAQYVKGK